MKSKSHKKIHLQNTVQRAEMNGISDVVLPEKDKSGSAFVTNVIGDQ